jgi:energy-coupling factor transporter ATP-binding protein EcfA2
MDTSRASLHFRNQLRLFHEQYFKEFKKVAEAGWPSLQIKSLEIRPQGLLGEPQAIALIVRENDFSDEVDSMGHGLQVWLQMAWFLARMREAQCIVLDEPDVYMHADVQRRLIRMLKADTDKQVIVATHSTEMMSEVEAEDVLLVDRREARSRFADSMPGVQQIIEAVGSIHNITLARLASAHAFLMVEGDDLHYLRRLHDTLYPRSNHPISGIPWMDIEGWTGWPSALGVARMLNRTSEKMIKVYCALDSDYHTPKQINERSVQAKKDSLNLQIWSRKEIESYLIVPSAIQRIIARRAGNAAPSIAEIEQVISTSTNALRSQALEATTNEFLSDAKQLGAGKAAAKAVATLDEQWQKGNGPYRVDAKSLLASISQWSSKEFKTSISATALACELWPSEIDAEMAAFLDALENVRSF